MASSLPPPIDSPPLPPKLKEEKPPSHSHKPEDKAQGQAKQPNSHSHPSLHFYRTSLDGTASAWPLSNAAGSTSSPPPQVSSPTPPPSHSSTAVPAPDVPPPAVPERLSISTTTSGYVPPLSPLVELQTPAVSTDSPNARQLPSFSTVQYDAEPSKPSQPSQPPGPTEPSLAAPGRRSTMPVEIDGDSISVEKTRSRDRDQRTGSLDMTAKPTAVSTPLRLVQPSAQQSSPDEQEQSRGRSASAQSATLLQPHPPAPQTLLAPSKADPTPRSHSAHTRDSSTASASRGRSWLPGLRSRSNSHEPAPAAAQPTAWVLAPDSRAEYNVSFLTNGEQVPELWDDNGGLYVYLYPRGSNKGASFKVRTSFVESSRVLSELVASELSSPVSERSRARSFGGRDSLTAADAQRIHSPPTSPPPFVDGGSRLHLPPSTDSSEPELERLVAVRNLFALLTGQPLVAMRAFPTAFDTLSRVALLLREFDFGYTIGSVSFGEAVDLSLGFYIELNGLADVRQSREKTLEALVLGERLRYWPLYNEAFCHAVGKYPALHDLKSSTLWAQVSTNTRLRLERAHLDLVSRQQNVNTRLEQFDFPSIFAGVGNSTSHEEYRNLRFKNWRASFAEMRTFVHRYYKNLFGSWPPKASSRRNPFTESGLNRLVLHTLYADLCSIYDLLVDRSSFTPRVGEEGGGVPAPKNPDAADASEQEPSMKVPAIKALRQMLAEFDQSSPPVLPPMPFDTPKIPTMASVRPNYLDLPAKEQARFDRGVQPNEIQLILFKSHNVDAEKPEASPFLAAYEAFELREAKRGKSEAEFLEMRIGHWLFMYVVLQSMPMLVVDAPGLQFVDGVEYFLCEPPQGRPPWVEDAGEVRKAWFQTAGGAGPLVELSADVLLYSVEATYHRSHCWLAAKKWEADASMAVAPDELVMVPAQPEGNMERPSTATAPFGSFESPGGEPVPASLSVPGPQSRVRSVSTSSSSVPNVPSLASLAAAEHSGSSASSPQIRPIMHNDEAGLNPSPGSQSPALLAQQNRLSQLPPAMASPSQPPPNYHQLQQRANLRHASIGWALEPVKLSDEAPLQAAAPQGHFRGAEALSSTRRIASAGNLRSMMDNNSTGHLPAVHTSSGPGSPSLLGPNHSQSQSQSQGPSKSQSQGHLLAPSKDAFLNTGSTFDSILGNMDNQKKSKKRNSFLPF